MADSPGVIDRVIDRVVDLGKVDFAPTHHQPKWGRFALATVLSVVLSLAADAGLVALATHLWPATRGYVHFQFVDYAALTIIGVLIGCAAWPIVTLISSAARWLFLRLAILVTLVLWGPDLFLLLGGQPANAVAILMLMHLGIALITYNLLVRLAPVRARRRVRRGAHVARRPERVLSEAIAP